MIEGCPKKEEAIDLRSPALIRATGKMAFELTVLPEIPSLGQAAGLFGEIVSQEVGFPAAVTPHSYEARGLRYAVLKAVEGLHTPHVLTDADTREVRYRHLSIARIGDSLPYGDLRQAVIGANIFGWSELMKRRRDWHRTVDLLRLNDEVIEIDNSSGMSPNPVRELGMKVGADSGGEVSCGGLTVALASWNSRGRFPGELVDDADQMREIAWDLEPWFVRRGHRPFQPIFIGRSALSFMNYGELYLARHNSRKWAIDHGPEFDNPQLGDPPLKATHLGCIVGIRWPGQQGPTDLERTVWAGINANYDAGLYSWVRARETWAWHPRRTLPIAKLAEYLKKQAEKRPPALRDKKTELLDYHIACNTAA